MVITIYLWSTGVALAFALASIGDHLLQRDRYYTYGDALLALLGAVIPVVQWFAIAMTVLQPLLDAADWISNKLNQPIYKDKQ